MTVELLTRPPFAPPPTDHQNTRAALPQIDPTMVGIPYLNQDALDLLSNCCTSKESDLWMSLGPNWTQTIDVDLLKASRLPSSFQPIFSDGWAPVIGELELIGLVGPNSLASIVTTTATMDSRDGSSSAGDGSAEVCLPLDVRQHSHPSARSHDVAAGRKTNHLPTSPLVDETPAGSSSRYLIAEHSASNYSPGSRQNRSNRIKQSSHHHHQTSRGAVLGSGLDYRRRTANVVAVNDRRQSPDIALYQHDNLNTRHSIDPYLNKVNQVPYGYMQNEANIVAEQEQDMRNCYRGSTGDLHQKRVMHSGKAPMNDNHAPHNSRHHQHQRIETIQPNPYDPILDYTLADDRSNLDVNLYRNRSRVPEDLPFVQHLEEHVEHQYDPRDYNSRTKNYPVLPNQYHSDTRGRSALKNNELNYYNRHPAILPPEADYLNEIDHEAMLLDLGPSQTEWFYKLQSRGALIVRVLFTREANNDKELSVRRGELLEVLDDSRKWWRTRNIDLQVAHVPHTIVAVMNGFQTLDELLASHPSEIPNNDPSNIALPRTNQVDLHQAYNQRYGRRDDAHNSKTSGAFRYF